MKKVISAVMAAVMLVCSALVFTSCTSKDDAETTAAPVVEKTNINILALKGPTGMGMAKLIADSKNGTTQNNYNVTVSSSTDDIAAAVTNGTSDIIACPLNLASVLYNKTQGQIQMLAVNTLGVLYIIENGSETIKSVSDLKGKTIYASGQGATPEYVLDYILSKNGLDPDKDVKIEWKAEHSELATAVVQGTAKIAVLPEPNVSTVLNQSNTSKIALNLTQEFEKVAGNVNLAMGCLIVRKDFAENNKQALNTFLDEYKASTQYVTNNIDDAAQLIVDNGIVPKLEIAKKAIPNCNIVCIEGSEMVTLAKANLQVLFDANAKSVGGKLPDDSFYYSR